MASCYQLLSQIEQKSKDTDNKALSSFQNFINMKLALVQQ